MRELKAALIVPITAFVAVAFSFRVKARQRFPHCFEGFFVPGQKSIAGGSVNRGFIEAGHSSYGCLSLVVVVSRKGSAQ